jgi:hypothetical protein
MCPAPAKMMTDSVLPAVSWLELLQVLRHQDFQEKSLMERKTSCQ